MEHEDISFIDNQLSHEIFIRHLIVLQWFIIVIANM